MPPRELSRLSTQNPTSLIFLAAISRTAAMASSGVETSCTASETRKLPGSEARPGHLRCGARPAAKNNRAAGGNFPLIWSCWNLSAKSIGWSPIVIAVPTP